MNQTATPMTPSDFIAHLSLWWPTRHESEAREAEWTRALVDALGFYSGEILGRAARRIVDTRKDGRFPKPAEIRAVCEEIVREDNASKLALEGPRDKNASYSTERMRLAYELLRTDAGRQAADEGWAADFHMFVRRYGEAPNNNQRKPHVIVRIGVGGQLYRDRVMCTDVEALRMGREVDVRPELYRQLETAPSSSIRRIKGLLAMAENIGKREAEMAAIARGEDRNGGDGA